MWSDLLMVVLVDATILIHRVRGRAQGGPANGVELPAHR
jgi:hypothetical protein